MNYAYDSKSKSKISEVTFEEVTSFASKGVRRGQQRKELIEHYAPVSNPTDEQVEYVLLNCHRNYVLAVAAANQHINVGQAAVERILTIIGEDQETEAALAPREYTAPEGYSVVNSEDGPYLAKADRYIRYLTDEEYENKSVEKI